MTADRWQEVARIHEAILERPAHEREAVLTSLCAGDSTLRLEVESLLAQAGKQSVLDEPVGATVALLLAIHHRLRVGAQVGAFRIESVLGAGGMGEVYGARDTKLGRSVALKVLPSVAANDPERLVRFQREAQVLAALNHPNIAAIYGIEDSSDVTALVLELVDGPTLADRITAGPLPLDEALSIARQLAAGLRAAHEVGIVHRDLKPANVKIARNGTVKVLDFGLARLTRSDSESDINVAGTWTPTGTVTNPVMLLGTAAYMSPEQARGRPADTRSDVWAFGCVLYEMLTGTRPFHGADAADTLASILKSTPDWSALPESVPLSIRRLLRRTLEKDRERRLADVADAALEIDDAALEIDQAAKGTGDRPSTRSTASRSLPRVMWVLACFLSAIVAGVAVWQVTRPANTDPLPVSRVQVNVASADAIPPRPRTTALALSPDGKHLVFVGIKDGTPQLFLRARDESTATPIPGTAGDRARSVSPEGPFFSPDGQWIGFWIGESRIGGPAGELRKVPLRGGPTVLIGKTPPLYGASWGDDGQIVYSGGEGSIGGLWRVRDNGGTPQRLTTVTGTTLSHRLPHVLPGSRAVVFTLQNSVRRWDDAQVVVRSLVTNEQHVLVEGAADARYVSTGHLVYMRHSTLFAAPFDLASLKITDNEIAMVDEVMQQENASSTQTDTGAAHFAVSRSGTLAYIRGGIVPDRSVTFVLIDRRGTITPLPFPARPYSSAARLSPDGRHLALSIGNLDRRLWIGDLERGTLSRFGPTTRVDGFPVWRGNTHVVFAGGSPANLFMAPVDGGPQERLTTSDLPQFPSSWSPDGKTLAFSQRVKNPSYDIWLLSLNGTKWTNRPFLETPDFEQGPEFSPDGRWIAYASNESGREEVYVRPFPGPGPPVPVSTDGGLQPAWAPNGRELFYTALRGASTPSLRMMAVDVVAAGAMFSAGRPRELFTVPLVVPLAIPTRAYDVSPDGQRFLMMRVDPEGDAIRPPATTEVMFIINWSEELVRRVPLSH